jgi:hypothetical protein
MSAKQNNLRDGNFYNNLKTKKDSYISAPIKKQKEEEKTQRLQKIFSKMASGRKLSSADMEYLRENAPEWYEKAVKIEKEREEFRRELENCKTKDDARMLYMLKMSLILSSAKTASANKSGESLSFASMQAAAMINEFLSFTESERYDEMPNSYEIILENKEKSEAQNQNGEDDFEFEDTEDNKNNDNTDNIGFTQSKEVKDTNDLPSEASRHETSHHETSHHETSGKKTGNSETGSAENKKAA